MKYRVLCSVLAITVFYGAANCSLVELLKGNFKFTTDVYGVLRNTSKNLFFSPLSIQIAIGLTFMGSGGNTSKQIHEHCYIPQDADIAKKQFKELIDTIKGNVDTTLQIANGFFVAQEVSIKQSFLKIAQNYFQTTIQPVDLTNHTTINTINRWISNRTNDKIKEVIKSIDGETVLLLISAIYFKGKWEHQFDPELTDEDDFYITPTTKKRIPYMSIAQYYKIKYCPELKSTVISLPYLEKEATMVILLPDEVDGWKYLEDKLLTSDLEEVLHMNQTLRIKLAFPKFKMESTVDLKDTLEELGVTEAFMERANFTLLSDSHEVFIEKAIQKTFIDVNEEGTEGATVTEVESAFRSFPFYQQVLQLNHPFVFFIRHIKSGFPVFVGRLAEP